MKFIVLFVFGSYVSLSYATEFSVFHPKVSYSAMLSDTSVIYKTFKNETRINKQSCNKMILVRMKRAADKSLRTKKITTDKENAIRLLVNGKNYLINIESSLGIYLATFPRSIKLAKIQERLLCKR